MIYIYIYIYILSNCPAGSSATVPIEFVCGMCELTCLKCMCRNRSEILYRRHAEFYVFLPCFCHLRGGMPAKF